MFPSGSSMVESDFSDHFVVRRQPDKNRYCTHEKDVVTGVDSAEAAGLPHKIGDQAVQNAPVKTLDDCNKPPKKLLTPFQFSKRPVMSSLFDGKRQQDRGNNMVMFLSEKTKPIPGRPKVVSDPHISPRRSSTSLLRPFTATVSGPTENESPSLRRGTGEHAGRSNFEEVKSQQTLCKPAGANVKSNASARRHPFGFYSKPSPGNTKVPGVARISPSQQKANVYRNTTYNPSNFIPLVPGPLSEVSDINNKGPLPFSSVAAYTANDRGMSSTESAGYDGDPYPAAPNVRASIPYMRPQTAIGPRFPYSTKPSVDPIGAPNNVFSTYVPRPGANHPYLKKPPADSFHKVQSATSFRYEVTSPLSPFYPPLRPYVASQEDDNFAGDMINGRETTTRHPIFRTCSQRSPIPLRLIVDNLINIRKVGEGVYGEVYKAYFRGFPDQRVYKVVPIEGSKIVNGEKQKRFEEVEPEIIVSQELNRLRRGYNSCYTDGHSRLHFARICGGIYPEILTEQWKLWHRAYVSQNDLPEFDKDQLYAVFEFEYHGTDIESYKFRNARQSLAVYLHVIHALAAAEAALEFEHRDLHWGNILVVKTREPYTTYTIQGCTYRVPNCGLKSTVIDYTISRLTNSSTGEPIFTDLAHDEDQFCGSEDYQFEIYRMMREENQNDWSKFCPKTNIFWAHYLVGKLVDKGRYSDVESPIHHLFRNKLCRIQNNILKYSSCMECVRRYLPSFCRDLDTNMF